MIRIERATFVTAAAYGFVLFRLSLRARHEVMGKCVQNESPFPLLLVLVPTWEPCLRSLGSLGERFVSSLEYSTVVYQS